MGFKKWLEIGQTAAAGLLALGLMSSAQAVYIETSPSHTEPTLQALLDSYTIGGDSSIDVTTDQVEGAEYWRNTDSGITPTRLVADYSVNSHVNSFGIFDRNDASNRFELFDGANSAGDITAFGMDADGSIWTGSLWGFGDSGEDFSSTTFGFYVDTGSSIFFSDSRLNAGSSQQMVAFQGTNQDDIDLPGFGGAASWTQGGWVLAFEDTVYIDSDKDFNDFVVFIESAEPVSEPGTVLLIAMGLFGLSIARRRVAA